MTHWQLVDSRDYLVAHYNVKPADKPAYSTSGNVLTIYEAYGNLAVGERCPSSSTRHAFVHDVEQ